MTFKILPIAFIFACLATVFGCNTSGSHSEKVRVLDSLYNEVNEAEKVLAQIPHDTAVKTVAKIKKDLSYVQKNYEGDMNKDHALKLADYRATSRLIKNYGERHNRLKSEIERTKTQLMGLKEALESGATEDKEGNKISSDYVEKAFQQEKMIAENLIKEIHEMKDRVEMMQTKYNDLLPRVNPILDSLKQSTV
jgi:superfamily I DNA and RNA helicase